MLSHIGVITIIFSRKGVKKWIVKEVVAKNSLSVNYYQQDGRMPTRDVYWGKFWGQNFCCSECIRISYQESVFVSGREDWSDQRKFSRKRYIYRASRRCASADVRAATKVARTVCHIRGMRDACGASAYAWPAPTSTRTLCYNRDSAEPIQSSSCDASAYDATN